MSVDGVYFDTSIIASCYLADSMSIRALSVRNQFSTPAPFTELHRVEVTAAFMAKLFRREATEVQVDTAFAHLDLDTQNGVWRRSECPLPDVFERAEALSRQWGGVFGTRTLDTLHVAAALTVSARGLATGDSRQAKLAQAVGLRVTLI